MAYCPYCGKQLNDGEVCSCAMAGVSGSAPAGPRLPTPPTAQPVSRPVNVPSAPAAPSSATSGAAPAPASYPAPAGAAPQPSRPAPQPVTIPQGGSAPQSGYAPQGGFAPQGGSYPSQTGYAPQGGYVPQSGYAPQDSYSAPQGSYAPQSNPEQSVYAPPASAPMQKKSSGLSDIVNPLIDRVKLLFSASPNDAITRSAETTDMSWALVFGAYVLLGVLAACFAVPKFMHGILGGFASYGDLLGEFFGGVLWRSLLINIITLGIALGTVMGVCGASKTKLPFARALNLVGMAFVPAVALNALGFLLSFFFPAGTLICGLLSSICTIVMLCVGLSTLSSKKSFWLHVIIASAMVLLYTLVFYIFMDAMVNDLTSSLLGGMSSMFW